MYNIDIILPSGKRRGLGRSKNSVKGDSSYRLTISMQREGRNIRRQNLNELIETLHLATRNFVIYLVSIVNLIFKVLSFLLDCNALV